MTWLARAAPVGDAADGVQKKRRDNLTSSSGSSVRIGRKGVRDG